MATETDKDMEDQLKMMKQLMEMQQNDNIMNNNNNNGNNPHIRHSSWDDEISDVMKRHLNDDGSVGTPDDNNINNVDLIEEHNSEAYEELKDIHAERDLIEKAFQKIDVENNEDIELDEFVNGLKKLGVKLNNKDMEKVFNLMDFDKSSYIDRNEFSMFLTQRYESKQLSKMQMVILDAIRNQGGNKHIYIYICLCMYLCVFNCIISYNYCIVFIVFIVFILYSCYLLLILFNFVYHCIILIVIRNECAYLIRMKKERNLKF